MHDVVAISIVIPVYNENDSLPQSLISFYRYVQPSWKKDDLFITTCDNMRSLDEEYNYKDFRPNHERKK